MDGPTDIRTYVQTYGWTLRPALLDQLLVDLKSIIRQMLKITGCA